MEDDESSSDDEVKVVQSRSKKDYTIDDIMQLDNITIGKKKVQQESKAIKKPKKKVQAKKSKKIIKF
jgi:hypothetical protein